MDEKKKAVVLLSAGLDSTIALYTALSKGFEAFCLTFDYGQRCREELSRSALIAETTGSHHVILRLDLTPAFKAGVTDSSTDLRSEVDVNTYDGLVAEAYVPARNLIFCSIAIAYAESIGSQDIFTGLYDEGSAPDCGKDFCNVVEKAGNLATVAGRSGKKFKVHSFHGKTKYAVIEKAIDSGMEIADTISCLSPVNGNPCGICYPCRQRKQIFENMNRTDPAELKGEI